MEVSLARVQELKDYYKQLSSGDQTSVRCLERLAIVKTLDMLGLDIPCINIEEAHQIEHRKASEASE